jgi:hypothetical protein
VRLAWEGVRLTHTSSIMLLGNLPPHISFINSFWPNLLRHGPLRGASGPADKVRPLVCKEGDHHLSNRLTVLADFPIIWAISEVERSCSFRRRWAVAQSFWRESFLA